MGRPPFRAEHCSAPGVWTFTNASPGGGLDSSPAVDCGVSRGQMYPSRRDGGITSKDSVQQQRDTSSSTAPMLPDLIPFSLAMGLGTDLGPRCIQPSLRDDPNCKCQPGSELPGYYQASLREKHS